MTGQRPTMGVSRTSRTRLAKRRNPHVPRDLCGAEVFVAAVNLGGGSGLAGKRPPSTATPRVGSASMGRVAE